MTKRLAAILFATIFFLGAPSPLLRAQDIDAHAVSLKGISALAVLVERLPAGAKVLGLTEQLIQADVEQKLRLGGVRVLTPEEAHRLPESPHLYVNINLTNDGRAARIDIELDQDVRLERNGQTVPAVGT